MNWFTSQSHAPTNFQVRNVIIIKFLREDEEIVGKVMLVNGDVKRNLGGKTDLVKVFGNESERVPGLKEFFGIVLTQVEIEGVKGRSVELLGA